MRNSDCQDCNRLQAAYEAATMEHIRLIGKRQIATYSFDTELAARIGLDVDAAEMRRHGTRAELAQHKAMAHAAGTATG
jgi:hypothetical protein